MTFTDLHVGRYKFLVCTAIIARHPDTAEALKEIENKKENSKNVKHDMLYEMPGRWLNFYRLTVDNFVDTLEIETWESDKARWVSVGVSFHNPVFMTLSSSCRRSWLTLLCVFKSLWQNGAPNKLWHFVVFFLKEIIKYWPRRISKRETPKNLSCRLLGAGNFGSLWEWILKFCKVLVTIVSSHSFSCQFIPYSCLTITVL